MSDTDPYRTLGVVRGCTHDEVKEAFRAKALATHPDRGGEELTFIRLRAAYEEIVSELDRRALVRVPSRRAAATPGAGRPGPTDPPADLRRGRSGDAGDIEYLEDVHDRGPSGHAVGIHFLPDSPDPFATRQQYFAWLDRVSSEAQRRGSRGRWKSAQFLPVAFLLWAVSWIPLTAIWSMVYTIPEVVRITERGENQAEVLSQFVVLSYLVALLGSGWVAWKYRDG